MSKILQNAFSQTLDEFAIQSTWLSEKAKVSDNVISRIRTGVSDPRIQTIGKLYEVIPLEVKRAFLKRVLGESITAQANLIALIERLDPASQEDREKAAEALTLLGRFYRQQAELRENTDNSQPKELLRSL